MGNNFTNIKKKIYFKQWWSRFLPIRTKQRKLKHWWSTIPPISTKQRMFKECWSTIPPISTKQRNLNSDGQQFHQYEQIEKSRHWWSTFSPISTKQKKVSAVTVNNSSNINKTKESLKVIVNNSSNINKTKESLNSDGQRFHQYKQSKRKFKQWWSTIPPISTKQKKA
jgi:DNA repair ATPase RecN